MPEEIQTLFSPSEIESAPSPLHPAISPALSSSMHPELPLLLPSTRYQGSKAKLIPWIWDQLKSLPFQTFLDAFGGTGVVSYWMKRQGKQVTYNDYLRFNYYIGLAIIENNNEYLSQEEIESILNNNPNYEYKTFITETFNDVYYTDEENSWLDRVAQNIMNIDNNYKRSLAYYALIQSCLIKRPFNLFHRRNLYLRLSNISRSFGNKATWDKPFELHFRSFVAEANRLVYNNNLPNKSLNLDVMEIEGDYDLVYLDPPYIASAGKSADYWEFYHFLEGIVNYNSWKEQIDYSTKNKRLKKRSNIWNDPKTIHSGFEQVFNKFKKSIIAVSYRADGIPSINEIIELMKKSGKKIHLLQYKKYKYALSKKETTEVLIIGD